jgi:glycosyltransferase involved in cell wall biosynthesis
LKILIICSGNNGNISPFIKEQALSLERIGCEISFFLIIGKGLKGYLKNYGKLIVAIKQYHPEIIHAHYGFSGVISCLASLFKKIPVVTTFHGTDININKKFLFSLVAILLSDQKIFVSNKLIEKSRLFLSKGNYHKIPCGVDLNLFYPRSKSESCRALDLDPSVKRILFSSAFQNPVKNFTLASNSTKKLKNNFEILEIKNRSREEVSLLLSASDVMLMTSYNEGSPQIIKEAMASNCPIVSTDVGDVKNIIGRVQDCYITEYDENEISQKLQFLLDNPRRTNGRDLIARYDNNNIAMEIMMVYKSAQNRK